MQMRRSAGLIGTVYDGTIAGISIGFLDKNVLLLVEKEDADSFFTRFGRVPLLKL